MGVEQHSDGSGERRVGELARHVRQAHRHPRAGGHAQLAFGYIEHSRQHRASSREHASRAQGIDHTALAQAFSHKVHELTRAWLQDFGHHAQIEHLRLRIGHLDFGILRNRCHYAVAVLALQLLGVDNGHLQANREIVGKMGAADGNRRRVRDGALEKHGHVGGVRSDVEQADAELAFVG
jgi:hypothetical protein